MTAGSAAPISFRGVTKAFGGTVAVDNLDFDVGAGEFVVLLGPSGCGKTSLLRLTAGLLRPDAGTISIGEEEVQDLPPKDRDVAMVFQSYALYPHLTVAENLSFPLKAKKVVRAERETRVRAVADQLGLDTQLEKRPEQLSGGQAQRVALGRAIVREPRVFLMDEPLSNLDAKLRIQVRVELKRLHQRLGITTLYVTHDQEEALTLGDSIAVLNGGRIEQIGSAEEIYRWPQTLFAARFVGSPEINTVEGLIASDGEGVAVESQGLRFQTSLSAGHARSGAPVILAIRPEAIEIGPAGSSAIDGEVDVTEMVGRETRVHVQTKVGEIVAVVPSDGVTPKEGDRLSLRLSASGVHLFEPGSGAVLQVNRSTQQEVPNV
jgi:multiple sugar transport system ATP-binding protein